MEKKTLQQAIEAGDESTVFHVGAKSGFFWIGTKEEYEQSIDDVSYTLLTDAAERLEQMRAKVAELPAVVDQIRQIDPETEDPVELRNLGLLSRRLCGLTTQVSYIRRKNLINKTMKYLEKFKPLREREVKEVYDRSQGDGVVVIVKGTEDDRYWTYEEYKTGIIEEEDTDE